MDFYFNHLSSEQFMTLGILWNLLPLLGVVLVHLAFSAAVFNDANRLQREHGSLAFVNCWLWSLAVLVGGVFVALVYWVMHYSTLAKH